MRWTLNMELALESLNQLKRGGSVQAQRKRYARLRRSYGWALVAAGVRQVPQAEGRRRVRITRLMGLRAKPMDLDNVAGGGGKALVDELVAFGVLIDDSPEHAVIEYAQEPAPDHGTRIELEEI